MEWIKTDRVALTDELYSPRHERWFIASEIAALRPAFNALARAKSQHLPTYILICTSCLYVGRARETDALLALGTLGAVVGGGALSTLNATALSNQLGRCPTCSQQTLVPVASPGGQIALSQREAGGVSPPDFSSMLPPPSTPESVAASNRVAAFVIGTLLALVLIVALLAVLSQL
jgi:hypothetical protein